MNWIRTTLAGRIVLSTLLGIAFAFIGSELAFLLVKNTADRDPQRIELVIPAGTAALVAAGQPVPSIPQDLAFVVGDVLVVKNQDSVSHHLGPTYVPPGASATLNLNEANDYAYECSFQPSKNLGITVRDRVSMLTRFQAVFLAGPPMAALIALYSLVIFPLKRKTT